MPSLGRKSSLFNSKEENAAPLIPPVPSIPPLPVSLRPNSNQPSPNLGAPSTQPLPVHSLSPANRVLKRTVYNMSHPEFGKLEITCRGKKSMENSVTFDIKLRPNDGAAVNDSHTMYVDDEDPTIMELQLLVMEILIWTEIYKARGLAMPITTQLQMQLTHWVLNCWLSIMWFLLQWKHYARKVK